MNIPFQETLLVDIGIALFFIVAAFFVINFFFGFLSIFRKKSKDEDEKKKKIGSGCMLRFLFFGTLLVFSIAVIAFAAAIQIFYSFSEQELIAEIKCEKVNYNNYTMKIEITEKLSATPKEFYLKGDVWMIKGEIIVCRDMLKVFGFNNSWYRLTTVMSGTRQVNTGKIVLILPTQDLLEDVVPDKWRWFYNFGKKMSLVKLIQDTIINIPDSTKKFEIYVTTKGFILNITEKE